MLTLMQGLHIGYNLGRHLVAQFVSCSPLILVSCCRSSRWPMRCVIGEDVRDGAATTTTVAESGRREIAAAHLFYLPRGGRGESPAHKVLSAAVTLGDFSIDKNKIL
jgi:hypothetical protein